MFAATMFKFWSRMLRGCVPDSVSLFRADTQIILVALLRGCVPDSVSLRFEFSFMNGSSFEPILGYRIILVAYATWLRSTFGFAAFRI